MKKLFVIAVMSSLALMSQSVHAKSGSEKAQYFGKYFAKEETKRNPASSRCLQDGVTKAQLDQAAAEYARTANAINAERERAMKNTSGLSADAKNAQVVDAIMKAQAAQSAAYQAYLTQYRALTKDCSGATGGCQGPNGSTVAVGESFPAADGCNTCACLSDGSAACTAMGCRQR